MSIGDNTFAANTSTAIGWTGPAYPCPACTPRCPCCGRVLTSPWYPAWPYYGQPIYYGSGGYIGTVTSGGTGTCSHGGVK